MMYYAIELDEAAKELCTIVTPFGKFQYCRLPMGLMSSPDIAQSIIEGVLSDLDVDVYIDDIGIFSNDYESHLGKIGQVLSRLEASGFKIIPSKCEWCVKKTDFLGYWLNPTGIKPWRKKVDAILKMKRSTDIKQLRSFLGAVTYYRNMWPRRSHLLAPLTQLTGKTKYEWSDTCEQTFLQMKLVLATDALLSYPNHNLPFRVYTDASDYQLGAAIIQNGRSVAYWFRKITPEQSNYTTVEKALLAVELCLKEFRTMLLGSQITVFTDHRNLTFKTLSPQRVLRWRLYLEDYHPTFKYIEGKENVLVDYFLRLPRMERPSGGKSSPRKGKVIAFENLPKPTVLDEKDEDSHYIDSYFYIHIPQSNNNNNPIINCHFIECKEPLINNEVYECFLNHPPLETMQNPITIQNIQVHQFEDLQLNRQRQTKPLKYPIKVIKNRPLICYR